MAGGGQPYDTNVDSVQQRIARLQEADRRARQRGSHTSPAIAALYEQVFGVAGGEASHRLLHRHYVDRSVEEG